MKVFFPVSFSAAFQGERVKKRIFKILLAVFTPNNTSNEAITDTNLVTLSGGEVSAKL